MTALREWMSATLAVALFGGGLFLYLVDELLEGEFDAYNQQIFAQVQLFTSAHRGWLDVAWWVTRTGDWIGYGLALVVALGLWRRLGAGFELRCFLLVLLGASALVNGLKLIFHLPRPLLDGAALTSGYAFPSGHTLFSTCLYGYVGSRLLQARYRVGWLVVLWPLAVAWSRVMLSRHWFSDVVGGTLLGCAWVALCLHWRERRI